MIVLWVLLLLPAGAQDQPVQFAGGFSSKEACIDRGQIVSTEGRFSCVPSVEPVAVVEGEARRSPRG